MGRGEINEVFENAPEDDDEIDLEDEGEAEG